MRRFWKAKTVTKWALAASLAMVAAPHANAASGSIDGDCSNFSFYQKFGSNMSDPSGQTAFVMRDGAPLFEDATSQNPTKNAAFSDPVSVIEVLTANEAPNERVAVSLPFENSSTKKKYWMSRSDLLCRSVPLRDKITGLERKALIRTKTTERQDGEIQAITAYRSPDLSDQQLDDSRRLSRFNTYLIYAESDEAYLLVERFNLSSINEKLVGWVRKEDVLNWNWAIGVRPALTVNGSEEGPRSVCGYASEALDSECIPILGGNRWFKTDQRLPVIDVLDNSYHVVGAASGIGGGELVDGKLKLPTEVLKKLNIAPDDLPGIDEDRLLSFNKVDLFFLIDGTRSMMPFIDAIRGTDTSPGVVDQIVQAIETRGGGASVRAGFRVFRDSVANGASGIDESYPLTEANCEDEDLDTSQSERRRFDRFLKSISTTTDDKDDFDENLFGGLQQAAIDMQGCPDRQKILFVISDAGYDASAQMERGFVGLDIYDVLSPLLENEKLTVFFIRPPQQDRSNYKSDTSYTSYLTSWNEYQQLGEEILNGVLNRDALGGNARDYFFDLSAGASAPAEMIERMTQSVKSVARPDVINEILIDLHGGSALEEVIDRLQREKIDVPVLFFNMIKRTVCAEGEKTCSERIFDGVFDLYIPKSEPLTLDAWLTSDQLQDWTRLLDPIIKATEMSLPEQRTAMGQIVRNSLQDILLLPTPEKLNEDIATFLMRSGRMPGPIKTPFLNYTFAQLTDGGVLGKCEVDRLRVWLRASRTMLANAMVQRLSEYRVDQPENDCPDMTPQGQRLKYIQDTPVAIAPGPDPDNYRLGRPYLGEQIFWVPLEYLP
ncbi:hypothetical protein [Rhizobium sp. L1K21]|uniref:hypothetical protein n=1 Tax=Rhizobium sp. L1K21 TaxID=2954933 RepID=UPI002093104A|nr:hypothetical protein [Rhizobium sp. L1K21]MCO6188246.1 hypothetical protein [Rhizobium sp. L1K21]